MTKQDISQIPEEELRKQAKMYKKEVEFKQFFSEQFRRQECLIEKQNELLQKQNELLEKLIEGQKSLYLSIGNLANVNIKLSEKECNLIEKAGRIAKAVGNVIATENGMTRAFNNHVQMIEAEQSRGK